MTWFRRADRVSDQWLADHAKRGDRIEFHGVAIRWPIRKLLDENSIWNKAKLRKSA